MRRITPQRSIATQGERELRTLGWGEPFRRETIMLSAHVLDRLSWSRPHGNAHRAERQLNIEICIARFARLSTRVDQASTYRDLPGGTGGVSHHEED